MLSVAVSTDPTQIVGINVQQPFSYNEEDLRGESEREAREAEMCRAMRWRSRNRIISSSVQEEEMASFLILIGTLSNATCIVSVRLYCLMAM